MNEVVTYGDFYFLIAFIACGLILLFAVSDDQKAPRLSFWVTFSVMILVGAISGITIEAINPGTNPIENADVIKVMNLFWFVAMGVWLAAAWQIPPRLRQEATKSSSE